VIWHLNARRAGPAGQPPWLAKTVPSDPDHRIKFRSTVNGRRLPPAMGNTAETLARARGTGGSPEGLPQRQGPAEVTRKSTASSERVGSVGKGAGLQICATAVASFSSGLQGPRLRCPWTRREGGVRFLGLIGVYSCRRKRQRGSRVTARISSSLHNEI
jgi:hypothetical protein